MLVQGAYARSRSNMITFNELMSLLLDEERVKGYSWKHIHNWIQSNGFIQVDGKKGSHPKYKHKDTGFIVTGINQHGGKDTNSTAVGKIATAIKNHHKQNNLKYNAISDTL